MASLLLSFANLSASLKADESALKADSSKVMTQAAGAPIVVQRGPELRVQALAFAPDGQRFATGSGYSVHIWNRDTGEVEWRLRAAGTISSLAWSPDGTRLAAGGLTNETGYWRGQVIIWDVRNGQVLHDWRTGYASISALAWTSDGRRLVTAAGGDFENREQPSALRLWSAEGELLHTFETYSAEDASVALSPDDAKLALSYSASMGETLVTRIYDVATAKPLTPKERKWLEHPVFAPDGSLQDEKLSPLPAPSSREEYLFYTAVSQDKRWLLTVGMDSDDRKPKSAFRLWNRENDTQQWKQVRQVGFSYDFPVTLAAPSGGNRDALAVGLFNGVAAVWDLRQGQPRAVVTGFQYWSNLALSPGATHLAASFLWDLSGNVPRRGTLLKDSDATAFTNDGSRLVAEEGLLDIKTGKRIVMRMVDAEGEDRNLTHVHDAAFSSDGKIVATVDDTWSDSQLHLWDGKTGKLLRNVNTGASYSCVAFAPQGDVLAAAGAAYVPGKRHPQPFLGLINSKTGALLRRFIVSPDDSYNISKIAFSPDGKTLATSGKVFRGFGWPSPAEEERLVSEGRIKTPARPLRFWDVQSGTVRSTLPTTTNYPLPVAFISNELCAVAAPFSIEFWNVSHSKLLANLTILAIGQTDNALTVEWLVETPDGTFDTSSGADRYLRWQVDGKLQTAPPKPTRRVPGLLSSILQRRG